MILALNGADFGDFGEFGASYSSDVGNLQAALVALGKGIRDATLMKIVVDGVIGPKTVAATNRALTVHLGPGQAPSNFRSGSLPQGTIVAQAPQITALLLAEISRRGFPAPAAAKAPVKKAVSKPAVSFTPTAPAALVPAAASPVYKVPAASAAEGGTDLGSVMMWAAIGVGVITVGGIAYYFATRKKGVGGGLRARTGVPGGAMSGFGNVAHSDEDALEAIIDRAPSVRDVFESISSIADGKAEHLESNWQDTAAAREWSRFARAVGRFGAKVKIPGETRARKG